jgi:hypothetical protein
LKTGSWVEKICALHQEYVRVVLLAPSVSEITRDSVTFLDSPSPVFQSLLLVLGVEAEGVDVGVRMPGWVPRAGLVAFVIAELGEVEDLAKRQIRCGGSVMSE